MLKKSDQKITKAIIAGAKAKAKATKLGLTAIADGYKDGSIDRAWTGEGSIGEKLTTTENWDPTKNPAGFCANLATTLVLAGVAATGPISGVMTLGAGSGLNRKKDVENIASSIKAESNLSTKGYAEMNLKEIFGANLNKPDADITQRITDLSDTNVPAGDSKLYADLTAEDIKALTFLCGLTEPEDKEAAAKSKIIAPADVTKVKRGLFCADVAVLQRLFDDAAATTFAQVSAVAAVGEIDLATERTALKKSVATLEAKMGPLTLDETTKLRQDKARLAKTNRGLVRVTNTFKTAFNATYLEYQDAIKTDSTKKYKVGKVLALGVGALAVAPLAIIAFPIVVTAWAMLRTASYMGLPNSSPKMLKAFLQAKFQGRQYKLQLAHLNDLPGYNTRSTIVEEIKGYDTKKADLKKSVATLEAKMGPLTLDDTTKLTQDKAKLVELQATHEQNKAKLAKVKTEMKKLNTIGQKNAIAQASYEAEAFDKTGKTPDEISKEKAGRKAHLEKIKADPASIKKSKFQPVTIGDDPDFKKQSAFEKTNNKWEKMKKGSIKGFIIGLKPTIGVKGGLKAMGKGTLNAITKIAYATGRGVKKIPGLTKKGIIGFKNFSISYVKHLTSAGKNWGSKQGLKKQGGAALTAIAAGTVGSYSSQDPNASGKNKLTASAEIGTNSLVESPIHAGEGLNSIHSTAGSLCSGNIGDVIKDVAHLGAGMAKGMISLADGLGKMLCDGLKAIAPKCPIAAGEGWKTGYGRCAIVGMQKTLCALVGAFSWVAKNVLNPVVDVGKKVAGGIGSVVDAFTSVMLVDVDGGTMTRVKNTGLNLTDTLSGNGYLCLTNPLNDPNAVCFDKDPRYHRDARYVKITY